MAPQQLQDLMTYLMWVYAGTLFLACVTNYLAVSRLKAHHRTKWQELECPTLSKPAKSSRYFLFGRYDELQDPILDRYVLPLRIATIVAVAVLLALFAIVGATFWDTPDVQVIRQPTRGEGRDNHPMNAVGAALLSLVAAGVLVKLWVLNRLKNHHRSIWQELECPTFWGWGGDYKVFRFMMSRRRKEIGDVRLNRLAIAMLSGFARLFLLRDLFLASL
jgi:pimeloyl-ACP methyl ester carboxylesterase